MAEFRERFDFRGLIDTADLCGLRDSYDLRLHVMLIADPVIDGAHRLYRELAVSTRKGDQLAASKPLGGATLVGVDVSDVGAHDSVIGACHCLQAEDIGGGAVENKKDFRVSAEVLSKF